MSFFGNGGLTLDTFASLAQSAVTQVASQVEKRIDRALDISESESIAAAPIISKSTQANRGKKKGDSDQPKTVRNNEEPVTTGDTTDDDLFSSLLGSTIKSPSNVNPAEVVTNSQVPTRPKVVAKSNILGSTKRTKSKDIDSPAGNAATPITQEPSSSQIVSLPTIASPVETLDSTREQPNLKTQLFTETSVEPVVLKHDEKPTSDELFDARSPTTITPAKFAEPLVETPPKSSQATPENGWFDDQPAILRAVEPARPLSPTISHVTDTTLSIPSTNNVTESIASLDVVPPPDSKLISTPHVAAISNADLSLLQERVEQRERQIMTLIQENASLQETATVLRNQLEQLEQVKSAAEVNVEELQKEFTKRMQAAEKKLQSIIKERDALKQTINQKNQAYQHYCENERRQLKERDEQIQLLLTEGENLSKEQLKSGNQIKKLKQNVKDAEAKTAMLTTQLEEANQQIIELQEQLKASERYKESGQKLQQLNETQTRRVAELEALLRDSQTKEATLQSNLQRAWSDISELRKENAESTAAAQSDALSKEIQKNEDLHLKLEKAQREAEERETALRRELLDLRTTLTRSEDMAGWREDNLRQEITGLQARLQASESRMEELRSGAEDSSRPLLRQIEALQTQILNNTKNWTAIEQSLTSQVQKALEERAEASERERVASLKLFETNTRLSMIENQLTSDKQERTRLVTELEMARVKVDEAERRVVDLEAKLEAQRVSSNQMLQDSKENYQALLRRQIQEERESWQRKLEDLDKRLKEAQTTRDRLLNNNIDTSKGASSKSVNYKGSDDGLEIPRGSAVNGLFASHGDHSDASTTGAAAVIIDRLSGSLKVRTAEVETLMEQLNSLRSGRDELAEELLRMTRSSQQMQTAANRVPALEAAIDELNKRYTATLELLGEKTEEVEELRGDLNDVKAIFRTQVTELLERIEHLSKS